MHKKNKKNKVKSNNSVRATSRTSQMSVIVHTEVSGSGAAGYQYAKCVFFEVFFFCFRTSTSGVGFENLERKKILGESPKMLNILKIQT